MSVPCFLTDRSLSPHDPTCGRAQADRIGTNYSRHCPCGGATPFASLGAVV